MRYVVQITRGGLSPAPRGTAIAAAKKQNLSAAVLDSLIDYRVVANFRTEESSGPIEQRQRCVIAAAKQVAAGLNEADA